MERDYLELSDFEVTTVKNGKDALELGKLHDFDMYILDIMVPGMDGIELCGELRKISNAPILMVSARKEDIDKIRALGIGADDYITKPFSPGELVARVKAHFARYQRLVSTIPQDEGADELLVRNLRVNLAMHRVWVDDTEKMLTTKEYELLLFLMEHPNQVFSKEELFGKVWDSGVGDIATVAVHIKKIREKIEANPGKPQFIETVWGVGYRFKV